MSSYAVVSSLDSGTITCEIDIAAPPERVFQALTDPVQLAQWFGSDGCQRKAWKFDARPGGKYNCASTPVQDVAGYKCHGEVVEFDPPHVLAYTWIADWHDDQYLATTVRYELTAVGSGTQVKVTHSGLANEANARKDYSGGWPGVLASLKKFTEEEGTK
jgi:uncharacterized protein YndB with AHSA1/START domain